MWNGLCFGSFPTATIDGKLPIDVADEFGIALATSQ
jgi:hypothetical protein